MSSASGGEDPTRALPLDPAQRDLSPVPRFVPLRNKFLAMPVLFAVRNVVSEVFYGPQYLLAGVTI